MYCFKWITVLKFNFLYFLKRRNEKNYMIIFDTSQKSRFHVLIYLGQEFTLFFSKNDIMICSEEFKNKTFKRKSFFSEIVFQKFRIVT